MAGGVVLERGGDSGEPLVGPAGTPACLSTAVGSQTPTATHAARVAWMTGFKDTCGRPVSQYDHS